jgi:tetratricopeptide (TPR) repeat protein
MEPAPNQEDKIDRYLRKEMEPEEQEAFEDVLNKDEALQLEVSLQRDAISGINLFGAESLKKQLQEIDDQQSPNLPSSRGRPLYIWLAVAASATVILLVTVLLLNTASSPQELYTAYYEPYPNVVDPVERSEELPTDPAGQAMYYYERGDFEEAITLFNQEQLIDDQAYRFYLGVSYLGNQQLDLAEKTLAPLLEDEQGAFYEAALWYTGLSNLANGEPEQAKSKLEKVVGVEGEFSNEAQELLNKL